MQTIRKNIINIVILQTVIFLLLRFNIGVNSHNFSYFNNNKLISQINRQIDTKTMPIHYSDSPVILTVSAVAGEVFAGFTLAEVLLTLLIIGIVASVVIPALINDVQDQQYKIAYKKAFAIASQAWLLAKNDNLIAPRNNWIDNYANNTNFLAFMSNFNTTKQCLTNNNSNCWADGEKYFTTAPNSLAYAFIDNSGMTWSQSCNIGCGEEIFVDINGFNKPNKFGHDRFVFRPSLPNDSMNGYTYLSKGTPIILKPLIDYPSYDANICQSPPCYYSSWLNN